ncbi:MAG: ABC transporter ATP-binding protein [Anaerolineales bacterium]|nr:ABC transporter ATP-binding protein [Anaerolineales bacterium]
MEKILEVVNLETKFHTVDGTIHALNGVTFDLYKGETLGVVGESGSGKSVTMMSLVGLIPMPPGVISAGTARFVDGDGHELDLLNLSERGRQRVRGGSIGFIFQDPLSSLNPTMTIGRQIAESIILHRGLDTDGARKETIRILEAVGIADAANRYRSYPHEFSGGMRQRVMIAIAVAGSPRIVIADEPTTALDVTVQAQIVKLMKDLQELMGMAVIWISHDLGVVAGLADRVLVMYGGTVVEDALVDELYENPQHPYTIGLLGAIPNLDSDGSERLISIDGQPPSLRQELSLCPFAPRCPHVMQRCWQERPPLRQIHESHRVACFYDVRIGGPVQE